MIKIVFILLAGFAMLKPIPKTEIVEGSVIFYYSKKEPNNHIDPPDMYCLDSIRFYNDDLVCAVKGDYLQNEYFIYEPNFMILEFSNTFRMLKLFCSNPLENHIHKGGEIYKRSGEHNTLFIAFNIRASIYHIIPHVNSEKNAAMVNELAMTHDGFLDAEECMYCPYFINRQDYYIISNILKAKPLTEEQQLKFKFIKAKKTEFWRYGQW